MFLVKLAAGRSYASVTSRTSMLRCISTFSRLATSTLAFAILGSSLGAQNPKALTREQLLAGLDADMRNVILLYDAIKGTRLEQLSPQDARQQFSAQDAAKIIARGVGTAEAPTAVGKVVDGMTIPGPNGTQIPIRIYYPEGVGPFPAVVYFHGGGFVVATIDTYDESARSLCVGAKAIVVSVEYRKAPEAPFPAAREDANNAYRWVTNNIAAYNGVAAKIAVAGESAGGNLAAEVTLAARNRELQMPTHALLIYPETTSNLNQVSDLLYTNSTLPLYTALLPYFDSKYVPNSSEANSPHVVPINADLKELPPTTIIAAEEDPLLSDGFDYAVALEAAHNKVTYKLYKGVTHEFFGMGAVVAKAKAAEQFGSAQLAGSFK